MTADRSAATPFEHGRWCANENCRAKLSAAQRRDPTRIPMGGVDKCLLCGWQGRPDEAHGCPRYRDSAATERERLRWEMHKVAWRIAHEPKRPCVNRKEKS